MMNILLVRTETGVKYTEIIRQYIESAGVPCYSAHRDFLEDTIGPNRLTPENTLVHARTANPVANENLAALESRGFKVINSSKTLNLTSNKYLSQVHARENGIPVADTYKVSKGDLQEIMRLLEKYENIVLKPVYSKGQGIYCTKAGPGCTVSELKQLVDDIPGEEIQVQQLINYKRLIRLIVIDFNVIREATAYDEPSQSWKCSVCDNPNIKKYIADDQSEKLFALGEKTARAFDARINYIDFFEAAGGDFILNEINTACNLSKHEKVTGINITKLIGDFLISEAEKLPSAKKT